MKPGTYKILLIDDRYENLLGLSAVLNRSGYVTDSALSGKEGLELLLKNKYGLIILDVQMPEMNGFEVAELIKGNSKTKNIPIIFYFDGIHEDYHRPTDEIAKIEFDLLAKRAQIVFYTAWEIANRELRIVPDKK